MSRERGQVQEGDPGLRAELLALRDELRTCRAELTAVRRSEARWKHMIEAIGGGAWEVILCTGRTWSSPAHARIFGYPEPPPDWDYDQFLQHIVEEDRARVHEAARRAMAEHTGWSVQCRIRRPDGEVRRIQINGRSEPGEAGAAAPAEPPVTELTARFPDPRLPAVRAWGIVQDITDRERVAEENRELFQLVEAERRLLDAILEAAPTGIIVADANGALVRMNAAVERLWGPAPLSRSVEEYDAWKGWWADGSERHGRRILPHEWAMARALRGEAARGDIVEIEPFDAPGTRRTMINSGASVRDAAGKIVGAVVVQVDITSLVEAEEAVRRSEERFRALADNMSQLAWIADETGALFWYNQRWFDYTGTTLEEVKGWGWKSVHHPDHLERVLEKFLRHVQAGEPWEDTFPLRGRDGVYRWFLSRAVPIRDEAGKVTRWFGTNTDITAQREAEEALREADRRKDEFLAVLAHELRNPLAPVRNAVHILRRLGPAEPALMRARAVIDRQVTHMARLIDDLLDVSRITRGRLELQMERCDLVDLVRQTTEDYRANLEAAGLSVFFSGPASLLWVNGDRTRLVQMVGNLLHNASRFTDQGGRVTVRVAAEPEERAALVTVEDTGVGMEPALVSRLFDPFSQAEQGLDRSKGGLGLGLALTRGLVELHGGSVTAHSEGLGRGSVFTLRIPLAPEGPRVERAGAPEAPIRGLRVLVIEDNEDAADSLAELLSLSGHQVEVAHDGRRGVEAAGRMRPDVVICDIGLPGEMDGHAVARALRAPAASGGGERRPFLLALSGYAQEEDRRRSREAGFDAHLAKPPDLAELERIVAGAPRCGCC